MYKIKRHQVKNACTYCQKLCKKCDDYRPCSRCINKNCSESCISSIRKKRIPKLVSKFKISTSYIESAPSFSFPFKV